ncbi:MAG TPA: b-glycosidase [Chloroflexota bacterium]|nr:b-glycosidase [Chloroflexota bacterium]
MAGKAPAASRAPGEAESPFRIETEVGIFPTFFMAGFECSTFVWKDGQRKDYVVLTRHDRELAADYDRVEELGIGVVREAIRFPLVDKGGGRYDWSSVEPFVAALEDYHLVAIWDLCHYGFPDDFDPFEEADQRRYVDYCRAAAEFVVRRTRGPYYFTPLNEITFFAAACTDMGWMYPFAKGKYAEMKRALCQMAIRAVKAIREVEPAARMVHVDPIVHAVPPEDRPDLADEAWKHAYDEAYEAWDMLAGRHHPELGGAPEILDVVGVNVYHFSQAQMNADKSREVLGPRDPRRKPLGELLQYAWERYHRPIIIGETSGYQDKRGEWLNMTMEESMRALNSGIDLQGVCLYPCVDIPDWNSGELAKIGIFDLRDTDSCERVPCEAYIEELRRWQRILDHPEHVEPDALERGGLGTVQLAEVRRHAQEWERGTAGKQTVGGR